MSFSSKENFKEVSTGQDILHTNSSVIKPKMGVTPGMKILRKKLNTKTKQKKTASTKKLPKLLLYVLSSVRGYRCVSKEAEKPLLKYIKQQR